MSQSTAPKILLVSANRERFPEPVFPVGLAYLASALAARGADVEIFDAGLHLFPVSALKRRIKVSKPDRIGVSLRNVDNAAWPGFRSYLPGYRKLLRGIRSVTSAPVILGGSGFSIFPEALLELLGADAGVTGDGEAATDPFFGSTGEKSVRGFLPDLAGVRLPGDLPRIFPDFRRYRTVGVQTARGCPHHCIFCTYPLLEGEAFRTRDPEAVADELSFLTGSLGTDELFFVDSVFNADEKQMESVLRSVLARKLKIRFSCYLKPRMADPGLFRLLKEAGCVGVDFGTDSGSPRILRAMRKSSTREDVVAASRACRDAGLDFCHSLVFGGPGESEESVVETVALMDEARPVAVIAMLGIRVLPGTEVEQIADREAGVRPGESPFAPRFYFGGGSGGELARAVGRATAGRRGWFFPGRAGWQVRVGARLLSLSSNNRPLWRALGQDGQLRGRQDD